MSEAKQLLSTWTSAEVNYVHCPELDQLFEVLDIPYKDEVPRIDQLQQTERFYSNPLVYSAHRGYYSVVRFLIRRPHAEVKEALVVAIRAGHASVVDMLLDHVANGDLHSALFEAADTGRLQIFEELVRRGGVPTHVDFVGAIVSGHSSLVKAMWHKASGDEWIDERTLGFAIVEGHSEIVALFLEHGVAPTTEMMLLALEKRFSDVFRLLIAHASRLGVLQRIQFTQPTVFEEAARDLDELFKVNVSVLAKAVELGNIENVQALFDVGVDIHDNDDAALCNAASGNNLPMVEFLLRCGANVNAQKSLCLHHAQQRNDRPLIQLLLDNGAQPDMMWEVIEAMFLVR